MVPERRGALFAGLVAAVSAGCATTPAPAPAPRGIVLQPPRLDVAILEPEPGSEAREAIEARLAEVLREALAALTGLPCRIGGPEGAEATLRLEVAKIEGLRDDPVLYSAYVLRAPGGAILDRYAGRLDTGHPPAQGPGVARVRGPDRPDRLARGLAVYAFAVADWVAGRLRAARNRTGEAGR